MKTIGPKVTIVKSCIMCKFHQSQRDGGCPDTVTYDVYCTHPNLVNKQYIGHESWSTPEWCPVEIVNKNDLVEIIKEAADILDNKKEMRFPIIDELHGFAAMLNKNE